MIKLILKLLKPLQNKDLFIKLFLLLTWGTIFLELPLQKILIYTQPLSKMVQQIIKLSYIHICFLKLNLENVFLMVK